MPRGIAQSPSLEVFKTQLERPPGNLDWSQCCPCFGQEEDPFKPEPSYALQFCAHNVEITTKAKLRELREGGVRLRGAESKHQGCYVLPSSGHTGYSTFWKPNCLEQTGCCTVFPEQHTPVYMVHSLLPGESIPEKTFWDQESYADLD